MQRTAYQQYQLICFILRGNDIKRNIHFIGDALGMSKFAFLQFGDEFSDPNISVA